MLLLFPVPSLIYAHITKPIDMEKEALKKQVAELQASKVMN